MDRPPVEKPSTMNSAGRESPDAGSPPPRDLDSRIARALRRARFTALFEVIWRRAFPVAWVLGLWVALSWLGLWAALPSGLRWAVVAVFAVALAGAVVRALWAPGAVASALDRAAAIRRIEAESGLIAHELGGLTDHLPTGAGPATERLWAVHRARLGARIGRLDAGLPHPDLGRRDRWALRPALGLLLFVGWFAAGDDHLARLTQAFRGTIAVGAEDRLDVWIDPPAYTGQPPLVLAAEGRLVMAAKADGTMAVSVPQGARLVVRVASGRAGQPPGPIAVTLMGTDGTTVDVVPTAPKSPGEPAAAGAAAPVVASGPVERVATLTGDVEARLDRDGRRFAAWTITVVPDHPPTIRLSGPPEVQTSGALKLGYETADDWGIASAEARFAVAGAAKGRALYAPPSFPLALPLGRAHTGKGQTLRDVTNHPFAGAAMRMTLVARDEAGQDGTSETIDLVLPQRPFRKPLARALIELRRRLATDVEEQPIVVTALDALMLAPERFVEKPATHLGLRHVLRATAAARGDDALREVVDLLWVAATTIEDGDLSDQEKSLRDAQEALRKALAEGASEQEIARLTRDLRQAMEKFLAAKSEQARRDPQRRSESGRPQRTISERDLQRMLDRIENLAKTGSREAAEKLLQEMREMMENLQAGAPSQGGGEGQGGQALEELGDMIRRQQKLMDDTHRSSRGQGEGEGEGQGQGQGGKGLGELREGQNALRDELKRFSEKMGPGSPGGQGEGEAQGDGARELGDAADAMGEAGDALGEGEGEEAVDAQNRALEGLRQGARKLADKMARQNGRGGREGDGPDGEDPLGRPRRREGAGASDGVKVPEEIDVERARRILEDIRKRLAEPSRPRFERDYLDRLLKLD